MPVEYQVQMVYEREDVGALVRTLDFRRRPEKNLRQARQIGYTVFGILLVVVGAFIVGGMIYFGAITPFTIVTMVLAVVCVLAGVALVRRADVRGMERRSWAKYPNKGLTITYTFYKDHFEEEDEVSGHNEFPYLSIKSANEDAGHYFLFTNSNAAHMLRKDGFIQGDPATFPQFLRKKAAVTVDPID